MTRRRILVFLPVLAILLVAGLFYALLHTGPGARWLWGRIAGLVPGQLHATALTGDLQSGLRVEGLSYRDEGIDLTVDIVTLRLDLDLLPPALAVHSLQFGSLDITRVPGGQAATASLGETLAALALPVPVEFKAVRGDRVRWNPGDEATRMEFQGLSLSADWFRRLALGNVDVRLLAPAMHWRGDLELGLQAPFALELAAAGEIGPLESAGFERARMLTVGLRGDLAELRVDARVRQPEVVLLGTLSGLGEAPSWDLQLSSDRLTWPLDAGEPELVAERLEISSYGWIDDYGLELAGRFGGPALPGLEGLEGRSVGAGDGAGMRVDRLEVEAEPLAIRGAGRLDWSEGFTAEGALEVERFDPSRWVESWGQAPPAQGLIDLAWRDGRVEFTVADLAAAGTVAELAGTGSFEPGSGSFEADVRWRDMAWPPGVSESGFRSPDGTARAAGRLEAWSLDANLELEAPGLPAGRVQLRGTGDAGAMAMEVPRGEVLGGSLAGQFALRWSPEVSWSARARFTDLATAPLAPSWPGRLSGEAALRGRPGAGELEADILGLNGVLRGRPVTAAGALLYGAGRLQVRDLDLGFGSSELSLDGDPRSAGGLSFRARIDSLADLLDDATGSLAGEGTISLTRESPTVRLNLQGNDLAWAGYAADSVRVETGPGDGAGLRVEVEGVGAGDYRIDTLALGTDSRRPLDRIDAEVGFADTHLTLALDGGVVDWTDPLAGGWRGSLRRLRWDGQPVGWIELEEAAGLSLDGSGATLEPGCFRGSRQGRLCLEGRWQRDAGRDLKASLQDVSPNLALRLAESDLSFTQLLSGTVRWRQRGATQPEATVDLVISAGQVRIEGEEEPIITTGPGRFGFEMAEGSLFAGNLDIPMPGSGGIDTDFGAPDLRDGLDSPLVGRLQVNLRDIAPLLELIPALEGSSGPVSADMRFSGTLADPRFTGYASLVRGRLSHFETGLVLENLNLAGAVYEFDQTELTGTFKAGEGTGSIRSVVNFDDILAPEILVELRGENLTLVNVPDLNVTANPDLRVIWREGALNVAGRVEVPSARLSPRYLPTTGAVESADVVIVAGDDPHARPQKPASNGPQIEGELELVLGEGVSLQLERATARLRGTALFRWDGPRVPTATGGLDLDGEINAYGQLLSVKEGRISFANRPADNPFLTIRAEREIFGNSQVRRAGVLVTGTLRRPVLETYTDPLTTRERALALLVTGNDFDYEQGVGAVEVGMYVAPRLFISYGVGLFDDQNVISARYDLGRGFGVKATSGQRETGADISYTIER